MTNQLDYRCPQCGRTDQIDICAAAWVRLTDDGTDADASHNGSHLWCADCLARCAGCGYIGEARDFDPNVAATRSSPAPAMADSLTGADAPS